MLRLRDLLLGSQLVSFSDKGIKVRKNDKEYLLEITEDSGECCGYNELSAKCFFEAGSERNPIITNVLIERENSEDLFGENCVLTFFGEDKQLAEVNSYSSSGSGWQYGACVTIKCDALKLEEVLSEW